MQKDRECNVIDQRQIIRRINGAFVDRETMTSPLRDSFYKVLEGNAGVTLITGSAGMGKTCLVEHCIAKLQHESILLLKGKHRQHSKEPYVALSEMIESFFLHVLTLPKEQYDMTIEKVSKAVGSDIAFLCRLSATAQRIYDAKITAGVSSLSKYRLRKILERFFLCISDLFYPLVLFIDDLQWADTTSMELLGLMVKDQAIYNVMLLLARRNHPKQPSIDAFMPWVDSVALTPLMESDVLALITAIFGEQTRNATYLSRILFGLTAGNPFYVKHMLINFCEEGVLEYHEDKKAWSCNLQDINHVQLPSDVMQMMALQLDELEPEETLLLEYLVCMEGHGSGAHLSLLLPKEDNDRVLKSLADKGMLLPISSAHGTIYRFVHDIIQESVYRSMGEDRRKELHYKVAVALAKSMPQPDNKMIDTIATQLVLSDSVTWPDDVCDQWVDILYKAGKQALEMVAYARGIELFEVCIKIMEGHGIHDQERSTHVLLALAKCHYLVGNKARTEFIYKELLSLSKSVEAKIAIMEAQMQYLAFIGQDAKVLEMGQEVLALLGCTFDMTRFQEELMGVSECYGSQRVLEETQHHGNPRIIKTLYRMMLSAQIVDGACFMYIMVKIAGLAAKGEAAQYTPLGHAMGAYIMTFVVRDERMGGRLCDEVATMVDAMEDMRLRAITMGFYATFVYHRYHPLKQCIAILEEANRLSLEVGDVLYCEYTLASLMFAYSVAGENMETVRQRLQGRIKGLTPFANRHFTVEYIEKCFGDHFHFLTQGKPFVDVTIADKMEGTERSIALVYLWYRMQDAYLSGDVATAYHMLDGIKGETDQARGHIIYGEVTFFSLLIRLEHHHKLSEEEREENLRYIALYKKTIKDASHSPHYGVRYQYAKGLYDAILGDGGSTGGLYNDGIMLAEKESNAMLLALGNMLAAKHYKHHRKLAKYYRGEAIGSLKAWGAHHLAMLWGDKPVTKRPKMVKERGASKELAEMLQAIGTMDEVQGFMKVLERLVEKAGCSYGAILMEQKDDMALVYEKRENADVRHYVSPMALNFADAISHRVVRYVARTGETVVLKEEPRDGLFARDSYLTAKHSIALQCVPFYDHGILIGVVYLEGEHAIHDHIVKLIKGIMPSLVVKCETIKEIHMGDVLAPQRARSMLTEREMETLELVAKGLPNSDISEMLGISTGTVKTHLSSIYNKLDVDSRIQAVVKAKELRIL